MKSFIALLAIHVAAALKHQFLDRRIARTAGRMPPFRSPIGEPTRPVSRG